MLTFAESPPQVYEIPRLDDSLIDELFYQEDEIGEMRHRAFMIECGLEQDPPDGPDVPPVPWLPGQVAAAAPVAPPEAPQSRRLVRTPPSRALSSDDIDIYDDVVKPSPAPPSR